MPRERRGARWQLAVVAQLMLASQVVRGYKGTSWRAGLMNTKILCRITIRTLDYVATSYIFCETYTKLTQQTIFLLYLHNM